MRVRLVLIYLVILWSGCLTEAVAQKIKKKVKFRHIESKSKLSNLNITSILQDTKGFLWVGTDDGLNRFDGYDFKIYRNIEGDSNSLVKNKIQCLFQDSYETLWVSTINSGLHRYDQKQDVFVRIPEFSFQHCQVLRIMEDSEHFIWIGGVLNSQAFVAKFNPGTNQWKMFFLFPSTDPIYSMLQYSKDEFLFGTRLHGLYKWNQKTNAIEHITHHAENANSLPGDYIEKMLKDKDGNIWIATRSGLSKVNNDLTHYKNFTAESHNQSGLLVNDIMDICFDNEYLWMATENGGLCRMDMHRETFSNFLFDKNDAGSIVNNSLWSLHKDKQGRLWVGSYAKGLCVLDNIEIKFSEVDIPLPSDLVNAILKDSKGRLWIGTEEGVTMQDKNTVKYFMNEPNNPSTIIGSAVNCIYEDSRKHIWIGTWNGGVSRFNEQSQNFKRYAPDPRNKNSLGNPNVFSIIESSKTGELMIGTFGGLNVLKDEEKGIFELEGNYVHEGDQLLLTAYEDSKKNIWVGSYNGLSLFDTNSKKYKHFFVSTDTTDISDRVSCILEDHKGRLWTGSFAGLHQMTSDHKFITYTIKDGLPVNIVQGILEDRNGNLWLGTTNGLSFFNPETKVFKTYDESDGLLTNDFRRKAFFKADDGRLFVGGKGINVFNPDSLATNNYKPSVYITDLKVFNQSVKPGGNDGILQHSITQTNEIFLHSRNTLFTLHYVGINFTASYKNQYAYKMEGFDKDWNYVGDQRFATFTNLDPGTYTFHVKAANNDGLWNEEGVSLIVHIMPPWWETVWFRGLLVVLLIVCSVSVYFIRINRIESQNKLLEILVDERTRELQETNEELAIREEEIKSQNEELVIQREALASQNKDLLHGQEEVSSQRDLLAQQNLKLEDASKIIEKKNQEILLHNQNLELEVEKRTQELLAHNNQLEQFAFISAHNLRAPVARILGLGEILKLAAGKPDEEKMILGKLILTTQELDRVVKDLNKILDIRKDNSSVITEIDLKQEMELIKINLQKEIDETGTTIAEDFSSVKVIQSVKPYIDSILMNLISNAIKYRYPDRKPVIEITSSVVDGFICLSVRDNGLGIDLARYEDKLFKLYSRFHSHVEGKGMGLYLVKTQVDALGGRIEVSSEVYQWLNFKIFLPIKMTS